MDEHEFEGIAGVSPFGALILLLRRKVKSYKSSIVGDVPENILVSKVLSNGQIEKYERHSGATYRFNPNRN